MDNKGQINTGMVIALVMGITTLIIGVIVAFVIVSNIIDIELDTTGYDSTSTTQTILTSSTDTLTPISDGITSSNANANNQTWLDFDGVNDYVNLSNPINNNSFTFSFWYYADKLNNANTFIGNDLSSDRGYSISMDNSSGTYNYRIQFRKEDNSGFYGNIKVGLVEINTWNHLVVKYDYGNISIYKNGSLINSQSFTNEGIRINFQDLYLGKGIYTNDIAYKFNGSIDTFLFYNRSLSDIEIKTLYNNYKEYYINLNNPYIDYSTLNINSSIHVRPIVINGSGTLYAYDMIGNQVIKSNDDFLTYTSVYNIDSSSTNRSRDMFIDSRGTIFLSKRSSGYIYMSMGNDTNWTKPFYLQGNCSAYSWWGMTEDNNTDLYVGCYGSLPYVYKSTTGGVTWNLIYNDSSEFGDCTGSGTSDHIHKVNFNKYNNCTYVAVGDDNACSKVAKTCDGGVSWSVVNNQTDQTGHVTSMLFTEDYNYFVTDNHGDITEGNGIWRTAFDNHTDVEYLVNFTNKNIGWSESKDNEGKLYFGTVAGTTNINESISLYIGTNNGNTWTNIYNNSEQEIWGGITFITEFYNGVAYFTNGSGEDETENSIFKFSGLDFTTPINYQRFNENSGTTAHDLSGNGNDGTITGATWNTDGLFVLLTEGVDYSIGATTGLFTILNDEYSWSEIEASWVYNKVTSTTSASRNMFGNFTQGVDNISSKIPTVLAIITVVLIISILVLLVAVWQRMNLGNVSI